MRIPGGARVESLDLLVQLPEGLTVQALPPPLAVANQVGSVALAARCQEDGSLRVAYRLEVRASPIELADWHHLRALLAPLHAPAARLILLARRAPGG